tara:strand:+ start:534 stop:2042 length:1509 start_codon:yes stop_codon:yes gene_type:complete
MQEEGSTTETTVETEDLGEGHIDTYTEVITTIEHATTGDILDVDTGIVSANKAGTLEIDWGGAGPIAGMVDCTEFFGEDTGKCGLSSGSQLTTFQQYIDLPFTINDGGQIAWGLDFHFKSNNATGYFETKGYNDGVQQWVTNQIALEDTGVPAYYSGTHDFAGGLDRVFISVGGYNQYYVDNVNYTVGYNVISSITNTWMEIVQPLIDYSTIMHEEEFQSLPVAQQEQLEIEMEQFDAITTINIPDTYEPDIIQIDIQMPEIAAPEALIEIMDTVDTYVAEIDNITADTPVEIEIETTSVNIDSLPAIEEPVDTVVEVNEPTTTEEVKATEGPSTEPEPEVAEIEPEKPEVVEAKPEPEAEPEIAEAKPETKEVVEDEKTVSEKPKPKTVKNKEEEKPKQTEVAEKKVVKSVEERKQARAEKIISNLKGDSFDVVTQTATLAIINALGSNMDNYQSQTFEDAVAWYEEKPIYTDLYITDPLGQYISLIDGVVMERMIQAQYE